MDGPEESVNLAAMNDRHHHYSNALPARKSNLRLNDQIIPKPTDINIGEKTIQVPTPKEHPYASHIPRFAMFPSYASSDGSATEELPNARHPVPKSAPDLTLLSKTKGSAYRHELLKPLGRTKKAVTWAGEHGFLEYPKPLKGDSQVFYPTPKTLMLPKPKVDLPPSEETNDIRRNLERMHWLTSYQMHYSGYEKANIKTDHVRKHIWPTRRNSHNVPQRDKPASAFVSSRLDDSHRGPYDVHDGLPAPLQRTAKSAALPLRPQESLVHYNEERGPNQRGHSEPGHSGRLAQAQRGDPSRGGSHRQRHRGPESDENITTRPRHIEDRALGDKRGSLYGKDVKVQSGNMMQPCPITTQHPVLPGIGPGSEGLSLKELQDSYSKTRAHQRFNISNSRTIVNQRDNVCTGRRHDFYGANAFYFHG